jgi:hypothetical protein
LAAFPFQGIAKGAMADFLAELFDGFDPEAQANTKVAEDAARNILAAGAAAVADRRLAGDRRLTTNGCFSQPLTHGKMRQVSSSPPT